MVLAAFLMTVFVGMAVLGHVGIDGALWQGDESDALGVSGSGGLIIGITGLPGLHSGDRNTSPQEVLSGFIDNYL